MHIAQDNGIYQPLRWTYGLVPIVAGLDKFTNLLTDWEAYLHPALAALAPLGPDAFMRVVGVIEIAAGLLVLSRFVRVGAWVVMAWLGAIALQLAALGLFDIAVRDVVMAVGAYSLARLAELRERATGGEAVDRRGAFEHAGAR